MIFRRLIAWFTLASLPLCGLGALLAIRTLTHLAASNNDIDDALVAQVALKPSSGPTEQIYVYRYEVTVGQFRRFTHAAEYAFDWSVEGGEWFSDDDWPMTHVSISDALAYSRWAHARLPSATEWVAIAVEQGAGKFPWGDCYPPPPGTANLADDQLSQEFPHLFSGATIKGYRDGIACLARVGELGYSPKGEIADLAGNVRELCSDMNGRFVAMGSSWVTGERYQLATTYKKPVVNGDRDSQTGFRCVADSLK